MSDTVLIALIGIIGTALSGIIVAAVSGWINNRNTKLQLVMHIDEFSQQIRYQQDEARRGRIVEARKGYLVPFRERLSSWIDASTSAESALIQIQNVIQAKSDPTGLVNDYTVQFSSAQAAANELWKYIRQISDPTLYSLLNDLWDAEQKAFPEKSSLAQQFLALGNRTVTGEANVDSVLAELQRAKAQMVHMITQRQEKLIAINKRVEVLLTGDEST